MRLVKHLEENGTTRSWKTPLSNYACAIRPVAAIMVTKIDGFSELADQNENAGRLLLSKSYKLQEYYFNHHGCTRVVKMGDTVLASFYSAEQAVKCAIKIQRGAQKMFNHKLLIGVHMGEVRYVDNDLFGNPVNVASDIQNMAKPGQVLVSESVAGSLDPAKYAIGLQRTADEVGMAAFEVKSRVSAEVSYLGYADSVNTRNIDHQYGWDTIQKVSGG
jgi:class 3 adenylate cyclase